MRINRSRGDESSNGGRSAAEQIELIRLDRCRPQGQEVAEVARRHADLSEDPNVRTLIEAGRQADLAVLLERTPALDSCEAEVSRADRAVAEAEAKATAAATDRAEAAHKLKEHDAVLRRSPRFPLLEDVPSWAVMVLLAMIALGEWRLNRAPLEVVGDDAAGTDLLAAVLGVGLVTAAHLAGVGLRRLLDRRVDWGRGISSWHHLSMLTAVLGMVVVAVALHHLREAFFEHVTAVAGHTPLAFVQGFLLWVAVLLSMAHDNPMRGELRRREQDLEHAQVAEDEALATLRRASDDRDDRRAAYRSMIAEMLAQIAMQQRHTARQLSEFAAGVQDGVGEPVRAPSLPEEDQLRVAAWRSWIERHGDPEAPGSAGLPDELRTLLLAGHSAPGARTSPDDIDASPQGHSPARNVRGDNPDKPTSPRIAGVPANGRGHDETSPLPALVLNGDREAEG